MGAASTAGVLGDALRHVAPHARGLWRPPVRLYLFHTVWSEATGSAVIRALASRLLTPTNGAIRPRVCALRHGPGRGGDRRITNMLPLGVRNEFGERQTNNVDLDIYGLTPKHRLLNAHPSINGDLIGRINTGVRRPPPARVALRVCAHAPSDALCCGATVPAVRRGERRTSLCGPTFACSARTRSCTRTAKSTRAMPSSTLPAMRWGGPRGRQEALRCSAP